ncbi:MAG: hypothetical protein ABIQ44_02780, partial [Chloroflexia bacterium]
NPVVPSVTTEAASSRLWDRLFALAVMGMVAFLLLRPLYIPVVNGDHYVYLARHMLQGQLSVNDIPAGYSDVITWQGNKYLPFGPIPSVILIPFLPLMDLFHTTESAWVAHLLTLLNIFLLARILKQMKIEGEPRKWALLLFFGGTNYYAMEVVSATWYFAHIVVITFLLLAVSEMLGKRRLALVGLFLGLAGMTRITALFALPFFLWLLWRDSKDDTITMPVLTLKQKLISSLTLFAGLAVPLILLLAYNYARFSNPLESGYGIAGLTYTALDEARNHGIFGLVHVPKNLFMMLFQGPVAYPTADAPVLEFPYIQPSPWGMGLFFTTPALLYLFKTKLRSPFVQACWLATLCVMVPIITYYGVGWVQFGYRYALDFLLFLVLIAAISLPKPLTTTARVLILASVAINIWGATFFAKWV